MKTRGSGLGGDLAVGTVLAVLLGGAWSLRNWTALHALALPDGDDAMRLQQVRDGPAGLFPARSAIRVPAGALPADAAGGDYAAFSLSTPPDRAPAKDCRRGS